MTVVNWTPVIVMIVLVLALAFSQWVNARSQIISPYLLMTANLALILVFTRITGTLLITPLIVCAIVMAIGAREQFARRPWLVGAWGAVALLIPITLEKLGVLASTFVITTQGIAVSGTAILNRTEADLTVSILGHVMIVGLVGIYAAMIMRGRNVAHRELHIQAWALQQLLPRRPGQTPISS
jgi:hypothetical protein